MLNEDDNDDNDLSMDDYDDSGFSNEKHDLEEALDVLDAALCLLAREKPTFGLIKSVELLTKVVNLVDRTYSQVVEYRTDEPLDFDKEVY